MLSIDTRNKKLFVLFRFFFVFFLICFFFLYFALFRLSTLVSVTRSGVVDIVVGFVVLLCDIKSLMIFFFDEFSRFSDSWTKRRFYLSNPCCRFCVHAIMYMLTNWWNGFWFFFPFIWCQFNAVEKWLFLWNSHQSRRVCWLFYLCWFASLFTTKAMLLKVIYLPEMSRRTKTKCVEWRHSKEKKKHTLWTDHNRSTFDW